MQKYSLLTRALFTFVFLTATSLVSATPITFNFTGTISEYILSNGQMIKSPSVIPKWFGKEVSGSIIMDLDAVVPTHAHSGQVIYESYYNNNFAQWMTFIINNPDGTSYTIPPAIDPLPEVEADNAATYLTYRKEYNDAQFLVGRNYSNLRGTPRQSIYLRLWGLGEHADQLLNTVDFNNVTINPEFANRENYGDIFYVKENGKKMAYYFTIDSLTRVTSEVPEPGSWCLLVLGFAGLMLKKSGRNRQHT